MRPFVRHLLLRPEAFDQRDRFFHPIDADLRGVVGHTELLVVALVPAGANPELEATARKQVERRRLFGQHHGIPVIVREHEATDTQCRRRVGDRGQRRDRRELIGDVIGHEEGVVTKSLGAARDLPPVFCVPATLGIGGEAKRAHDPTLSHYR